MAVDAGPIIQGLQKIVGEANVIHHPEDLLVYEYDGSIDTATPLAVAFPTSTDEVSRLVRLAHAEGLPVVGRGSGNRSQRRCNRLPGWPSDIPDAHEPGP